MKYGWDFPPNSGGGQSEGLNVHGIDFFRANHFEHLAREIIQNSLDAKNKNSKEPVLIKFNRIQLPSKKLPGKQQLENIFELCAQNKDVSSKDKDFFEKGKAVLNRNNIDILKISDYQTTGLRGVYNNENEWKRLINKGGASNKNIGSGGSYGIGKNAPFACSQLHTVYYSTFNVDGEKGFQGVSKLASHNNEYGETRGTGYYRELNNYRPITDLQELDQKIFHRDEFGTDLFVTGLKTPDNWKEKVIKAVLDNFFVAIYEGKLNVEVDHEIIKKDNINNFIEKYIAYDNKKDYLTDEFFHALTSNESKPFIIPFKDMGHLELFIKEAHDYNRKVAMVRETGMKIFHLDRFPAGFYFSGVMIAKGKDLNEFLRQTEPPTHDNWKADIYEGEKNAEKILKDLRSYIRDKVKELSRVDEYESIDIEGMTDFLPDLTDEGEPFESTNGETADKPKETDLKVKKKTEKNTNVIKRPKRKKQKNRKPNTNPNRTNKPAIPAKINRIRSRATQEEGTYKISIYPDSNGIGFVQVKVVGEDARTYNEPFEKVLEQGTSINLSTTNDGKIGPLNFEKSKPKTIFVTLQNNMRCSLEVSVHED